MLKLIKKNISENYLPRLIYKWAANNLFPMPKNLNEWEKKNIWFRRTGMSIGSNVAIGKGFFCLPMKEENIYIGNDVAIGYNVRMYAFDKMSIGSFSMIAADVIMTNGGHDTSNFLPFSGSLMIGNGCWIGSGVKIVGPLKIGNNVIVGAGAVVVNDVPDCAIVVGVPARVIGYRHLPDKVWHFGDIWYSPYTFEKICSS